MHSKNHMIKRGLVEMPPLAVYPSIGGAEADDVVMAMTVAMAMAISVG